MTAKVLALGEFAESNDRQDLLQAITDTTLKFSVNHRIHDVFKPQAVQGGDCVAWFRSAGQASERSTVLDAYYLMVAVHEMESMYEVREITVAEAVLNGQVVMGSSFVIF